MVKYLNTERLSHYQSSLTEHMKRLITLISIITLALSLSCCSTQDKTSDPDTAKTTLPVVTNMAGSSTSAEVCNDLTAAGLSNVVVFSEWVADFAGTASPDAGLTDQWTSPDASSPDLAKCMDGWERHYDYSDADCRMTAFLLMDGLINSSKTDKDYDGTYLMFDVDAINNVTKYEVIKKNIDLFTTLFGERTPKEGEEPSAVFGRIWSEYGFSIQNDKASLLNIVFYDPDLDQVFVGHSGILVETDQGLLFVEKLAFEQPYQATKAKDMDQLLGILAKRPEYFGEEGEAGPFVYRNGEYLCELQNASKE
jgi:hypothetical protein